MCVGREPPRATTASVRTESTSVEVAFDRGLVLVLGTAGAGRADRRRSKPADCAEFRGRRKDRTMFNRLSGHSHWHDSALPIHR